MRKLFAPLLCVVLAAVLQPAVAGPLEDIFEAGITEHCQKDKMFGELEEIFAEGKLSFDGKKSCSCVARKIAGDNRVIAGFLSDNPQSSYAKLAVMAYTAQCLSIMAEEGMSRLR